MRLLNTIKELQAELSSTKGTIGFVPTMGALHVGHLSLVERAKAENDVVVVSIFVNPTQFNDKNDLQNYPRTLDIDMELLKPIGVDFVFAPSVEEIYPQSDTRMFDFGQIDKVMEGACRKGHFNGVGQVVSRLFELINPDRTYFGEKDFQQLVVIKEMVRQLGLSVEIIGCLIVRDFDGLALSSRNALLSEEHRAAAPHIYEVLLQTPQMVKKLSPSELEEWVISEINKNSFLKTIYFQAVDGLTLQPVTGWKTEGTIQGCIAVEAGDIRLIDNIRLV